MEMKDGNRFHLLFARSNSTHGVGATRAVYRGMIWARSIMYICTAEPVKLIFWFSSLQSSAVAKANRGSMMVKTVAEATRTPVCNTYLSYNPVFQRNTLPTTVEKAITKLFHEERSSFEGLRDLLQSRPPFLVCMLEVFSSSLTEDENAVQINFRIEMCHLNECQLSLYLLYEECAGRSVLVAMRRSQCQAPELKKCSVAHLLSSSNAQTFMFLPPPRT
ncbi:hypothetical protein Aperf_G00000083839 [Anoplocephala perfoliata]